MNTVYITERWDINDDKFLGWEVCGGFFQRTFHKTLKSAEKEKKERIAFVKKFPFIPPKSKKGK